MRKIDRLLTEYGASHQNHVNKIIHWCCVPAIFFSFIGLVWSVPNGFMTSTFTSASPFVSWASMLLLIAIAYYLSLSILLSIGMTVFFFFCLFLSKMDVAPLWLVSIGIFIVAWLMPFIFKKLKIGN